MDSRDNRLDGTGSMVDWTRPAEFHFATEIDALNTVEELADELRSARRQVDETMRYLKAAIAASARTAEGPVKPQALIGHSGLARQTVYDALPNDAKD
jgi:hypothetical protein